MWTEFHLNTENTEKLAEEHIRHLKMEKRLL